MSIGQYGRDDSGVQIAGALTHLQAKGTQMEMVFHVASTSFDPLVCPNCTGILARVDIDFDYLWGQDRIRCRECLCEGSERTVRLKDKVEAKGACTHYDLERETGLKYGVSLGVRRRDMQDGHVKRRNMGGGRSPDAGNKWIVDTGFVRYIPERDSRQTIWIAFRKFHLRRSGELSCRMVRVPEDLTRDLGTLLDCDGLTDRERNAVSEIYQIGRGRW